MPREALEMILAIKHLRTCTKEHSRHYCQRHKRLVVCDHIDNCDHLQIFNRPTKYNNMLKFNYIKDLPSDKFREV